MCTDRVHPQVSQEVPYHSRAGRYATVCIGVLGMATASGAEPRAELQPPPSRRSRPPGARPQGLT